MLTTNLSGYPTKPNLKLIKNYLTQGGTHPYDMAVKEAVRDQLLAGLDIVTDGQVRDTISIFGLHVPGIESDGQLTVRNKLSLPDSPSTVGDFVTALKEVGDAQRVKAIVPGPLSFIERCELDITSNYRRKDDVNLIFDVASIIKYEIEALRDSQASVIQIIEFVDHIHDIDLFTELLDDLFKKVKIPICHIDGDISGIFFKLLDTKLKVISFDLITYPKNGATFKFAEEIDTYDKTLALGCVDASSEQVELLPEIEHRITGFIEHLDHDSIWISPNQSLERLSREIAFRKLQTLRDLQNKITNQFR